MNPLRSLADALEAEFIPDTLCPHVKVRHEGATLRIFQDPKELVITCTKRELPLQWLTSLARRAAEPLGLDEED